MSVIARAVMVGAVVAAVTLPGAARRAGPEPLDGVVLTASSTGTFAIRGHVAGLYPGKVTSLRLTITNPNSFTIRVTSVTAGVGDASRRCVDDYVSVSRFSGSLRVAPQGSRHLNLEIALRRSTPNACESATFPLSYHGTAVRA